MTTPVAGASLPFRMKTVGGTRCLVWGDKDDAGQCAGRPATDTEGALFDEIERLRISISEAESGARPCCGEYAVCNRPCTPRGKVLQKATDDAYAVARAEGLRWIMRHCEESNPEDGGAADKALREIHYKALEVLNATRYEHSPKPDEVLTLARDTTAIYVDADGTPRVSGSVLTGRERP